MNGKRIFYSEAAYVFGIVLLAVGTAMMERADLGMSMVVAPAYLLYLRISQSIPAFSFGMAEYCLQAVLLIALTILTHKINLKYLFSFGTAVFYGYTLDLSMKVVAVIPPVPFVGKVIFYVLGFIGCAIGVSLLFHTYISPEAYELFVKEISARYGTNISKTKTVYDCCSCLIAVLLSFVFFGFGHFEGIKIGTIVCAVVNGSCIGICSKVFESRFTFKDAWKFRRYFE